MAGVTQGDCPWRDRVAILRDPTLAVGIGQLGAIQSVAPSFRVEASPMDVRNADEIERAITDFARTANSGLIVTASPGAPVHRKLIITWRPSTDCPRCTSFVVS